jgi:hypothetical protein
MHGHEFAMLGSAATCFAARPEDVPEHFKFAAFDMTFFWEGARDEAEGG